MNRDHVLLAQWLIHSAVEKAIEDGEDVAEVASLLTPMPANDQAHVALDRLEAKCRQLMEENPEAGL